MSAATSCFFPDINALSLRQLIGQMVVVRTSGHLFDGERNYPQWEADWQTLSHWIQAWHIGGVILLGGSAAELSLKTCALQELAAIPLFIAADIEEGVGQRFSGATWFPPPMALGEIWTKDPQQAIALAENMGAITAQEALALGINWLLAPVMDVNNNPLNPVINVRAFGDRPQQVAQLGTAFIRGAQNHAVLTCAKHFPGHGDTDQDSHLGLPTIAHDPSRLSQVEIPPFQAAIAAGVDAVMTAHLRIPAWDQDFPATLSHRILTEQLRQNMGFSGLIVTDALMMGGITQFDDPAEVAVKAIEAGTDILLMPPDPLRAIAAVEQAVEQGRLTKARIQASVERIWNAKQKLHATTRFIFPDDVAIASAQSTARDITQKSMQVGGKLPLPVLKENPGRNLIVVDSYLRSDFLKPNCPAIAIPQNYGFQCQIIEAQLLPFLDIVEAPTLVQFFSRGNPFRGHLLESKTILQQLFAKTPVLGVLFYGSPHFLSCFLEEYCNPDIGWGFAYGQMPLAQELLGQRLWRNHKIRYTENSEFM